MKRFDDILLVLDPAKPCAALVERAVAVAENNQASLKIVAVVPQVVLAAGLPLNGPVTMDLTLKDHRPAELLSYLPNVEQLDAHRVRFVGSDILEVSSFFEFALNYSADLKP